jgi:hypothetical protein
MPIEKIIALASAVFAGVVATHPLTWRVEVRKLEYSILKEVSDTRSWGTPSFEEARRRDGALKEGVIRRNRRR